MIRLMLRKNGVIEPIGVAVSRPPASAPPKPFPMPKDPVLSAPAVSVTRQVPGAIVAVISEIRGVMSTCGRSPTMAPGPLPLPGALLPAATELVPLGMATACKGDWFAFHGVGICGLVGTRI